MPETLSPRPCVKEKANKAPLFFSVSRCETIKPDFSSLSLLKASFVPQWTFPPKPPLASDAAQFLTITLSGLAAIV